MNFSVTVAPLVNLPMLGALAMLVLLTLALAVWRGGLQVWVRALGFLLIGVALLNPSLQTEERRALSDIILVMVDRSTSQSLGERGAQTETALAQLRQAFAHKRNIELREYIVSDAPENRGTLLSDTLNTALAEVPRDRLSAVFVISDGRLHDPRLAADISAPMHHLMTGSPKDWDRALQIIAAPRFGIVGEEVTVGFLISDRGAVPSQMKSAEIEIRIGTGEKQRVQVPVGQRVDVPLRLDKAGQNLIHFRSPAITSELTGENNTATVKINGIRDRLRVLLISGQPHPGTRTWRNLLKSDPAVDLVHFTILRPPEKQDGTPVTQLSLIAFPTRELFMEKVDDFDLIIFDRYQRRGILPAAYFENIVRYVEDGGAVLVSAGPDFAGVNSIYRSPLGRMLPAAPTERVIEEGFLPEITELGKRHPVTNDLGKGQEWGKWFRQIGLRQTGGDLVMTGHEGTALLILHHFGQGRVAFLGSDHAWLWERGVDGGGPQRELLRRVAHWSMAEPELEEERLTAVQTGHDITLRRNTLREELPPAQLIAPDGTQYAIPMVAQKDGSYSAIFSPDQKGIYKLSQGKEALVFVVGSANAHELVRPLATKETLANFVGSTMGGHFELSQGFPSLRKTRLGRRAAGPTWAGYVPRNAYRVVSRRQTLLIPSWLMLLLLGVTCLWAWLREGRRA